MKPVVAVWLDDGAETSEWIDLLAPLLPDFELRPLEDPGDPAAVRYAVAWMPPEGQLARFPNLRAIASVGAGIDHLLRDPELPRDLPILRTTGPDMVQRMREYVALHVLAHHRALSHTHAMQAEQRWRPIVTPVARHRRVGIMGLGQMGAACARTLAGLGFETSGWARSPRQVEGVAVFTGWEALHEFIEQTDILVCLLPATDETRDILNARLLALLPQGASLINAGRGDCLVEEDLIAALDSGQLSGATLDVFRTEPLPPSHPFWRHSSIRITPHIASMIDAGTGAEVVASNLRSFDAGHIPPDATTASQGY